MFAKRMLTVSFLFEIFFGSESVWSLVHSPPVCFITYKETCRIVLSLELYINFLLNPSVISNLV
ncbi:hypothetical protein M758_UG270300 [Ceratodon purpureus]|nr:hypothetical protein M758_UG270300 [Ceratodon purpureus]